MAVTPDPDRPGTWNVRIAIPPELLSDGVQTFLIRQAGEPGLDRLPLQHQLVHAGSQR